MISKKISIAVAICMAILLTAIVAYAYIQMSSAEKTSKTFTFSWEGDYMPSWSNRTIEEQFGVTTFWMNITFERTNETHLIITAKVNDLYQGSHLGLVFYLGLVFDVNHNGEIDEFDDGWMYMAQKYYCDPYYAKRHAFLDGPYNDSQRVFYSMAECYLKSAHTCDFDSELGFTYVIPVNIEELELINDLIHVEYGLAVAVEFQFGRGLIV